MSNSDMSGDDKGLMLFKRADALRAKRSSVFDPNWQYISQYFWPDVSDINTQKTEGTTGWFDRIYDSEPVRASATCSIGVRNWVTPSTEPWLGLAPPSVMPNQQPAQASKNPRLARLMPKTQAQTDDEDSGLDDAARWLNYTAEELTEALASSNFYSTIQPFNRGACVFGTALLFCEEGKDELFKFEQFKVGTFCIAENDQKRVDTVFRWFKLTVRQAAQKFGVGNLPQKMTECIREKRLDQMFEFMHCCYPNEDFTDGVIGKDGMAFASVYIALDEKKIVSEAGYEELPYFCLRWSRWGTDDMPWGCSPAFETLPEARQINFVTQFQDALAELKAFPRILYPDNLDGNIQLAAGSVTVTDSNKPDAVPKEWLTEGESGEVIAMLERKEKAIKEAFFVDIFRMFDQLEGNQPRTAYEIAQRLGEKLDKFTGTFDQYVTELINPLVRRMLGIALRAGRLKPAPQSLMVQGADPKQPAQLAVPKIVINSRVTLAIKSLRNGGTQNTLTTIMPLVVDAQRPDVLDNFNLDKMVRDTGRNFGMPEKDFNSMQYVIQLRAQRSAQQQAQQQAAMAEQMGKAAGALGSAPQQIQDQISKQVTGGGEAAAA